MGWLFAYPVSLVPIVKRIPDASKADVADVAWLDG